MKNLLKQEYIVVYIIIIVFVVSMVIALNTNEFNAYDIEKKISDKLQLKEELLKTYKFSGVKTSIFSPLVMITPPLKVVEPPKKELPTLPPPDPYESYNKDLKTYQVFGFTQSGDEVTIFLSKGNTILTLKKGSQFDGKYFIKDIKNNEVIVGLLTDNGFEFTIK